MAIAFNEQQKVFRLDTPHTTYLIGVVDDEGFLGHIYYGPSIPDDDMQYLMRIYEPPYVPSRNNRDRLAFLSAFPTEYSGHGQGDFRESCLQVETAEGCRVCGLTYDSHKIYSGKPALDGLPATYGGAEDCATLELHCKDAALGLEVILYYTAFSRIDAITRSARIVNHSGSDLRLQAVLSACLDLDDRDFDTITLHGSWSIERMICRNRLGMGKHGVSSLRGISSHQEQPFLALAEHTATQEHGLIYAMHFVYSGNFLAQAEKNAEGQVRMVMGIHPTDFCWTLAPGEAFQAPEVVLVCSDTGLDGMTHAFHDLYRKHLVRGPWRDAPRPALINNWEGTYFDFDEEKLLAIAREAAAAGLDLFVMDDGWFGRRDDDNSSLGDWYVDTRKLPHGLPHLVEEVNKLGLRFGIWIEPEMVSPDSDLYRAHPDYALQIPGRTGTLSRNQLVLDFSRREVRDCVYAQIRASLGSANIAYVKWDMNRALTDAASCCLGSGRQGELFHRYVLGVYELQQRLLDDFPGLLLENCCSGGGRFDPGMLYYSPQIWTSDNTDAIDRLRIQEGTALLYPFSTMGMHVAACPSHTNGRVTPFATRGLVALPGCFGYELDLTALSDADKALIPGQLAAYRRYNPIFRTGDYYRLASFAENGVYDVFLAVTKDKTEAAISYVQVLGNYRSASRHVYPRGLDPARRYRHSITGETHSGAGWMRGGILLPRLTGDDQGQLIVLTAEDAHGNI